jgi:hypothetical protein
VDSSLQVIRQLLNLHSHFSGDQIHQFHPAIFRSFECWIDAEAAAAAARGLQVPSGLVRLQSRTVLHTIVVVHIS